VPVDPHGRSAAIAAFSPLSSHFLVDLFLPAITKGLYAVEPRDVRFNIKKRRTVKDIRAIEAENVPFAAHQFHDTQTDGIGATGRPRGKNAPFYVLEKRLHGEFYRFRQMEMVDQINSEKPSRSRKPLHILEISLPARGSPSHRLVGRGGSLCNSMLALDYADWFVCNAALCHFATL
jgi:hypothetical protein